MALTAGQRAITGTRLRTSHNIPTDPERRKSYLDGDDSHEGMVVALGKQGFDPFINEKGEILCSRCLQLLGKDDTVFCVPCHVLLDGILAASRNPTSVPAVS